MAQRRVGGRKYDICVFGATSSVGVEIVKYLSKDGASQPNSWCIAGRSAKALEAIAEGATASGAPKPDILIADVKNGQSLRDMVKQATVCLTTVGPYVQFGEAVIEACIAEGTHYADITGEVPWVSLMKKKHQAAASKAGVHILSFCGYDSIPAEMGVFLAAKELSANGGPGLVESFHAMSGGGFPAGTVETILHGVSQGFAKLKGMLTGAKPAPLPKLDGQGLVPDSEKKALARSRAPLISWSAQAKAFTPVHFMAPINTSVVHSSAAALGYGGLRYNERLTMMGLRWHQSVFTLFGLIPSLVTLWFLAAIGACAVAGILRPVAKIINYLSTRSPPRTHVTLMATSQDKKKRTTVTMSYPGDPGILFTAVLCVETARVLAQGGAGVVAAPGFSTPAVALGDALLARITAAGVKVTVKSR